MRSIDQLIVYVKSNPVLWRLAEKVGLSARGVSDVVASKSTDICIGGYESSANSYTYNVIWHLGNDLDIAHHCHAPASIKIAVKRRVPTLILFRDPEDAIPSVVSRFRPNLYEALIAYIRFYETVLTLQDAVMLVSFEEATQHTERMLRTIEHRTDISFASYTSFEEVDKAVKAHIRAWKEKSEDPSTTPLPTERREQEKRAVRSKMMQEPKYKQAADVYQCVRDAYQIQQDNLANDLKL